MTSSYIVLNLRHQGSSMGYLTGELQDYSSLQNTIYYLDIIFGVLVLVAIALRMHVRLYMIKAAGADDALMVVASASALVLFSVSLAGAHQGLGKHEWNLDSNYENIPGKISFIIKIEFAAYMLYATAISFTKFSIIASYIRLFPQRSIRRVSYATGFIVLVLWICNFFAMCFACYPIEALWDRSIAGATCFPLVHYLYIAATFNIATDITLCVLPIPILWSLQMPRAQRIAVSILFSFGMLACIASVMRITRLHDLNGDDISWVVVVSDSVIDKTVGTLDWSIAEVGLAIFCSCTSALRPLASKIYPKFFQSLLFQLSSSTLSARVRTKTSRSCRPKTSQQSLVSQEVSDDGFDLIHYCPDATELFPPTPPLKDRAYLNIIMSRNESIPTG